MKAQELLRLYQSGERNFRGQDLSGQSFRGKDLSGIDLSRANIQGADFTNAILRKANFSKVKTGLQQQHAFTLGIVLVILAALLGIAAGLVDSVAEQVFHSSSLVDMIPKWLALAVLSGFAIVWMRNGIASSFLVFILAFIVSGIIAFASSAAVLAAGAIAIAITIASFVAVATTILVVIMAIAILACSPIIVISAIVAFSLPFLLIAVPTAGESAIGLVVMMVILGTNITWSALRGNQKHASMMRIAAGLTSRWGTRFHGADLTHADFTQATLKNVDFSDAILTYVRWDDKAVAKATINGGLILS